MIQVKGVHKSYSKIGGGFFKKDKLHVLKGMDFEKGAKAKERNA